MDLRPHDEPVGIDGHRDSERVAGSLVGGGEPDPRSRPLVTSRRTKAGIDGRSCIRRTSTSACPVQGRPEQAQRGRNDFWRPSQSIHAGACNGGRQPSASCLERQCHLAWFVLAEGIPAGGTCANSWRGIHRLSTGPEKRARECTVGPVGGPHGGESGRSQGACPRPTWLFEGAHMQRRTDQSNPTPCASPRPGSGRNIVITTRVTRPEMASRETVEA